MVLDITWEETSGEVRTLDVDALMREGVTPTSELTENPIEFGADVTDHIRDKSASLTLEFVITNTPIRVPRSHMSGVTGGERQVAEGISALAFDSQFDRVKAVYSDLERVRKAGLLCRIESDITTYTDYQLEQFSVTKDQNTGDSANFTLTLKRAKFVSTRIAPIPQRRPVTRPTVNAGTQAVRPPRESGLHRAGLGTTTGGGFNLGRIFGG